MQFREQEDTEFDDIERDAAAATPGIDTPKQALDAVIKATSIKLVCFYRVISFRCVVCSMFTLSRLAFSMQRSGTPESFLSLSLSRSLP